MTSRREAVNARLADIPADFWGSVVAPLVRHWLASGRMDFLTGRAIDGTIQRLIETLEVEKKAEADDVVAEESAIMSQRLLLSEVDANPIEEVADAVLRKHVRQQLRPWRDPYAEDAAGEDILVSVIAMMEAAGGQSRLLPRVRDMLDAGRKRDESARLRRQAIGARVALQDEVIRTFRGWWLCAPDAVVAEVADRFLALQAPSIEDDWFVDPFES